jgi:DNA primase
MPIPDELIEQVRDSADIVSLLGDHVELKRSGADYRGPCPFHGGTHRNFAVIARKQMYYCFVCHEAGDVFTFFMKRFGMDYPAAVREVARRTGIVIPERPQGGPDPREPLYSAVAIAAEWYARRLQDADDAAAARHYLAERGFEADKLAPHGLGYAPKGDAFLAAMETLGIRVETLIEAGLAVRREDGMLRPRFWQRLLFPIHDLRGRVVAFGGRVLGDGEPKYLNSPDTPIFHKGSLLYNLHAAKHAIRKAERAIVVEGYFDALRLTDAGIEEVVAPLGTAMTAEQATLIRRYTDTAILLYDSDKAGLRASFRAADTLLAAGARVLVATPPPGEDPDLLVRQRGADGARAVLDDAMDVLERKIQLLERKGWLGSISGRRRALDRLLPTLRAPQDAVTKDLYLARAAEALGVSRPSIEREVAGREWRSPAAARAAPPGLDQGMRRPSGMRPDRHVLDLIRVALREPSWRPRVARELSGVPLPDSPERRLLELVAAADATVPAGDLVLHAEPEGRAILARLLEEPWGGLDVSATVAGAWQRIAGRQVRARMREIDRQIRVANESEKDALLREKAELRRRLTASDWKVARGR